MDTIDTTSAAFHAMFDSNVRDIMEPVREILLEGSGTCGREEIVAQMMMETLFPHPCDPNLNEIFSDDAVKGHLTPEQKMVLVRIANHLGPDWAQALYHAAVFITKVA